MGDYKVKESELQGLIFDCDGTLIDTMPAYWDSWKQTCRYYRLEFNEKRYYSLAGVPVRKIMQTLIDECYSEDAPHVDKVLEVKKKLAFESIERIGTPPISCVIEIAKKYHGKVPLAVASSGFRDHVEHSLKSNGIYHLFDAIVTAEDIKHPKPAPDIFLEAAKRIKADPTKCRGYEDADLGMISVRAAGMEAIDVRLLPGYPLVEPSEKSVLQKSHKTNYGKILFRLSVVVALIAMFLYYCYTLLVEAIKEEALGDD